MIKRVFIIHGWDGYPEEGWFPWLKKELESRSFDVIIPQMPQPDEPRINNWIPKIKEVVGEPDTHTYFVGHSMGCQAIVRYISELPEGARVGGAIFVAGFFKRLIGIEDDEVMRSVVKEWLETPVDFASISKHLNKSIAIFSDNDPYVPMDNQDDFEKKLQSKIIVEHDKFHFSGKTGTTELPIALSCVLEVDNSN